MDLNKSAKDNFLILLEKNGNNIDLLRKDFNRKIKFYDRTSRGSQKMRNRNGKSFNHKLMMYKRMDKLAFEFSLNNQ